MWLFSHLDPEESLGEILFGLIMVLTFTLGAGVAAQGSATPEALIYAAIGANIAWAIIDAVFFLMGQAVARGRRARVVRGLRRIPDEAEALDAIGKELDFILEPVTRAEERSSLYRNIYQLIVRSDPPRGGVRRDDLVAAAAVLILVAAATVPAAVPFFLVTDPWLALRLSNFILIGCLFFVGYRWACFTDVNPWLAGAGLTVIGLLLVAVAIALGG